MSKFLTNARKVTLARSVGALAGGGIVMAVTKNVMVVCPVLSLTAVGIALGHHQMVKADKLLKENDSEYTVPATTLIGAGLLTTVKVGLCGVVVGKLTDYAKNRHGKGPDVIVATDVPECPTTPANPVTVVA